MKTTNTPLLDDWSKNAGKLGFGLVRLSLLNPTDEATVDVEHTKRAHV